MEKPIGVIGSGLGGLAAAATLAARGHKVICFERNKWLGGKAAVLSEQGFRFDMGPTILTVPNVIKRIFEEAKRDMCQYLNLVRLEPQWRSFFEDGSTLDLCENQQRMAELLEKRRPGASEKFKKFMRYSEELHDISERWFFWKSVGGVMDTMSPLEMLKPSTLSDLLKIRMGSSAGDTIRSYIPDERASQMFDHYMQYVGSAPDQSPQPSSAPSRAMQSRDGVWYPIGGTRAVPEALAKLGARTRRRLPHQLRR